MPLVYTDQPVGDVEECPTQEAVFSRPPSSPSNSWSSAETANAYAADSPGGQGLGPDDARRPKAQAQAARSREPYSPWV